MTLRDKIEHRKYLKAIKESLYKKLCSDDNPYKEENKARIDFVIDKVFNKQILNNNPYELRALDILTGRGFLPDYQAPIPILSEGGKLEHLYLADILINNTIIEIDGKCHNKHSDSYRDKLTKEAGYITKRYSTSEIYKLKEETFD